MQNQEQSEPAKPGRRSEELGHVPQLDGVRALAIIIVLCAHLGLRTIVPGGFGVTVFFFLSGYLITSLIRVEMERTGKVNLVDFYVRRVFRILPAMYITVIFFLILANAGLVVKDYTSGGVWLQIFFLHNYKTFFDWGEGVPSPLWSLAVEEHFYFIFPVVFSLWLGRMPRRTAAIWCGAACVVALLLRLMSVAISSEMTAVNYTMTHTRMDSILFGSILALWNNPILDRDAWRPRLRHLAVAVATLLLGFLVRDEVFRQTLRYSLQGVALFVLFSYALQSEGWLRDILSSRVARVIGLLSYTIYLAHVGLIEFTKVVFPSWPDAAKVVLAIILTLLYSAAMYVAVERPALKLRKLIQRGRAKIDLRPAWRTPS